MTDPYAVLGLDPDADEAAIRRRYLELVREYPPERAPERFAEIRNAYDKLRDPLKQLEKRLFDLRTEDSLNDIRADVVKRMRSTRIPTRALLDLAELR